MRFAKWTFLIAGIYGILVIAPQFFLENRISAEYPPAITHPEHFYGFLSVALAWQVLFILIGLNPVRLKPAMLTGVLEKLGFAIAVPVLFYQGRVNVQLVGFAGIDALLAVLFIIAFLKTCDPAAPVN